MGKTVQERYAFSQTVEKCQALVCDILELAQVYDDVSLLLHKRKDGGDR
ncbi:hypothetical protein [Bartonella massiliensis]|nr:hypothetical protein [Bartonella massiliensis]